jgi:type II secretory pathway component PulF
VAIRRQTFVYFVIMSVILVLSVSFLVTFIVPTLKYLHQDFGLVEMSGLFRTFLAAWDWLAAYAPLWILLIVTIAFLVWAMPSRRFFRRALAGRWFRGTAQTRSSQLMQLLATTVEAGRPVPSAISTLARYHFDHRFRRRLLFARNEIEQGADVWKSLADSHLMTAEESQAIALCSSNESRAWAMRQLANWKLHEVAAHRSTLLRFIQPLITILFAGLVLLVGGAMIGFLAQMIHSLGNVM